ncbi:MAG: glycosyltransferase family 2 protein, partial [Pedobacter sp.]
MACPQMYSIINNRESALVFILNCFFACWRKTAGLINMHPSVVIITKNEAHIIGNTLRSLEGLAADIVIVDSGSTDDTISICRNFHCHIIETKWLGYGPTKNLGIDAAGEEWILSIDADEAVDESLKQSILALTGGDDQTAYKLNFHTFFGSKRIRFGAWGKDKHIRLFNRKKVRWNDAAVHENLVMSEGIIIKEIAGNILHYTSNSIADYQ